MNHIMSLTKRSIRADHEGRSKAIPSNGEGSADEDLLKKASGGSKAMILALKVSLLTCLALCLGGYASFGSNFLSGQENRVESTSSAAQSMLKGGADAFGGAIGAFGRREVFEIDGDVKLNVEFSFSSQAEGKSEQSAISLGPHKVVLAAAKSSCPSLGFWLHAEGDALATALLIEDGDSWIGSISFPISGISYELVAYWRGCDGQAQEVRLVLKKDILAQGDSPATTGATTTPYPNAAWISSNKFDYSGTKPPYIWHDPSVATTEATLIKTSSSLVSKEGATFKESGFYSFGQLSNYELVCWVGSKSAEDSRLAFLEERHEISPHQRPFKFHIYPISSFVQPDLAWTDDSKTRFRKCKHILVSLDEIQTSLTQKEYADQVTVFVQHLLKAFPDETFPIWMFTVNESPRQATNCRGPFYLPRTSDHPCNDALKDLFDSTKKTFPERVHLLDNTALSLPQLVENRGDVFAAIALRIFVLVGKKVGEWRRSNQIGQIDGLHRGDNIEPNFELVAYEGWK